MRCFVSVICVLLTCGLGIFLKVFLLLSCMYMRDVLQVLLRQLSLVTSRFWDQILPDYTFISILLNVI